MPVQLTREDQRMLIHEYVSILLGNKKRFDSKFFKDRSPEAIHDIALFIIKYAYETYIKWSPEKICNSDNTAILEMWKLQTLYKKLIVPPDIIREENYFYLAHLMYPRVIQVDREDLCLNTYIRILKNEKPKFPKNYFSNDEGKENACSILRYVIDQHQNFHNVAEMYDFFGTRKCIKFLRDMKLTSPAQKLFASNIQYLHTALPTSQQNNGLYYHYSLFQICDNVYIKANETRGRKLGQKTKQKEDDEEVCEE